MAEENEAWQGEVNINDERFDKAERWHCKEGQKVVHAVGWRRFEANGKPALEARYVCVLDLEALKAEGNDEEEAKPDSDEGLDVDCTYWLTNKGMWLMVAQLRALGNQGSFNPFDDDQLQSLMTGYFTANVEIEEYQRGNGKTGTKAIIGSFEPFESEPDPEWQAIVDDGAERHAKYLDERAGRDERRAMEEQSGSAPPRRRTRGDTSKYGF